MKFFSDRHRELRSSLRSKLQNINFYFYDETFVNYAFEHYLNELCKEDNKIDFGQLFCLVSLVMERRAYFIASPLRGPYVGAFCLFF